MAHPTDRTVAMAVFAVQSAAGLLLIAAFPLSLLGFQEAAKLIYQGLAVFFALPAALFYLWRGATRVGRGRDGFGGAGDLLLGSALLLGVWMLSAGTPVRYTPMLGGVGMALALTSVLLRMPGKRRE